ncbi:MAG: phage integrase SAM-like domain-containing protein [Prevotella sp.]|nr:phage integrase SAM-like domain-containing protein [Prevotella sp.]
MERITIFARTTKKVGSIKLRFRIRDGREVDIYHPSNIKADIRHLAKFTDEGDLKAGVKVYNEELYDEIQKEIGYIKRVYKSMGDDGIKPTSEELNKRIDDLLHPQKDIKTENIIKRFEKFTDDMYRDGVISENRIKHYEVLRRIMERFLLINGKTSVTPLEFDASMLRDFRDFLRDEYKYVPEYKRVYCKLKDTTIPKAQRSSNTCAAKLKILKLFFDELKRVKEIEDSPLSMISPQAKKSMLRSKYDVPVCLTLDEFKKLRNTDVPDYLKEAKDAFIVHCMIGCRISDFKALTMANVGVRDGIAFIHYLPIKTSRKQADNKELESPLPLVALELIKRYNFDFRITRNTGGHIGYNEKIKRILQLAGIDRPCAIYNEQTGKNDYKPLYEVGSSKLARKTYVDRTAKVDIDIYQSGLHKRGSEAAKRYVGELTLKEKFIQVNRAFDCKPYRVDDDLNIIEDEPQENDLQRMVEALTDEDKKRLLEMLTAK